MKGLRLTYNECVYRSLFMNGLTRLLLGNEARGVAIYTNDYGVGGGGGVDNGPS